MRFQGRRAFCLILTGTSVHIKTWLFTSPVSHFLIFTWAFLLYASGRHLPRVERGALVAGGIDGGKAPSITTECVVCKTGIIHCKKKGLYA